jgi:CheY-like chemotaxis protein
VLPTGSGRRTPGDGVQATFVGEAATGDQAVEPARRLRPDVCLVDIRMPGLDGIEVTRRLAGPDVADPLVVVVITTFDLDEYVHEALRAGARGFLLKDAWPDLHVQAVQAAARGDALIDSRRDSALPRNVAGGRRVSGSVDDDRGGAFVWGEPYSGDGVVHEVGKFWCGTACEAPQLPTRCEWACAGWAVGVFRLACSPVVDAVDASLLN